MGKEEVVKQEAKKVFEKTQVVTQTSPAILDTKTNEAMSIEDALIEILNKLEKIEKAVIG